MTVLEDDRIIKYVFTYADLRNFLSLHGEIIEIIKDWEGQSPYNAEHFPERKDQETSILIITKEPHVE